MSDVLKETLKNADNEITDSPYWIIIDPMQMLSPSVHQVASMVTGPFFCREDAEAHLQGRRHAFSHRAKVYCHSGCWSRKYKDFCLEVRCREARHE